MVENGLKQRWADGKCNRCKKENQNYFWQIIGQQQFVDKNQAGNWSWGRKNREAVQPAQVGWIKKTCKRLAGSRIVCQKSLAKNAVVGQLCTVRPPLEQAIGKKVTGSKAKKQQAKTAHLLNFQYQYCSLPFCLLPFLFCPLPLSFASCLLPFTWPAPAPPDRRPPETPRRPLLSAPIRR